MIILLRLAIFLLFFIPLFLLIRQFLRELGRDKLNQKLAEQAELKFQADLAEQINTDQMKENREKIASKLN